MHISSWAAMTKRHHGRQWHCRTIRTINLDYVWPPQATQWPDGWTKHIRQSLGCGNSIPRCVFPLSRKCGALIGVRETSRDMKKDGETPVAPNDSGRQARPGGGGDRRGAPAASWCDPAGESPAQVRRSVRLVASVAWPLATVGAKRTQRLHGVWD